MTVNQPLPENTNTNINTNANTKNQWLWIGLGAALLFCCCAALVALLVFRQLGKAVKDSVTTDSDSASQTAHEIIDYDLPAGYTEQMAMDMKIYTFIVIGPESYETNGSVIMIAHFTAVAGNQQQMEQQIRQSMEQQSGSRGAKMELVEVKTMTIRGEETEVSIYEGTDVNGTKVRQLITSFPGKSGVVMLLIFGNVADWDQDMVDEFIESIR